jgi:stage II sporulation protein AA (anti-sigma F factor antagonist)
VSNPSPEVFAIDVSQPSDGFFVVSLAGEMDIASAPELSRRLDVLDAAGPGHVIVDLSKLTFIDSSGINALVVAAKAIQAEGGLMTLVSPTPHTQRVFEIVHLSEVVAIEESLAAAVARAESNRGRSR